MPDEPDERERIRTPEEAFDTIGEATRIGILQALGDEEPQPFAQLRKRVGVADSGLFNYHLGELTGHFVQKTSEGYALREPGSRIVQAVLSGAVMDPAVMEPTELDAPCPYCGESIEIMFKAERLVLSCDNCPGSFDGTETDARFLKTHPSGTVAVLKFPPAGLAGRSPHEVLEAALGWTLEQIQAMANGHCPRCAAVTERSLSVCDRHDEDAEICTACGGRYGALVDYRCTNCTHVERNFPVGLHLLLRSPDLLAFVGARGTDPVTPSWAAQAEISAFTEVITGVEPFAARYRYVFRGDEIEVVVNEDLTVTDVDRSARG